MTQDELIKELVLALEEARAFVNEQREVNNTQYTLDVIDNALAEAKG